MTRSRYSCSAGPWIAVSDSTAAAGGNLYCHVVRATSSCDPTPIEARALVGESDRRCANGTLLASRCSGYATGTPESTIVTQRLPDAFFRFATMETSCVAPQGVFDSKIMTVHLEYPAGFTPADVGIVAGIVAACLCVLFACGKLCVRRRRVSFAPPSETETFTNIVTV